MQSDLRRKLIREVLDSDKNINKHVSQIQIKKYTKRRRSITWKSTKYKWDARIKYICLEYKKILDHKANISKLLLSYSINQDTLNKYVIDISSIEELMSMYS